MRKSDRVKTRVVAARVPQTREETIAAIAEIGLHQRERTRIETAMNDALAEIRQKFEEDAAPHADQIRQLAEGVEVWCEAHRGELTEGGKTKTASFASGEVRWRITPPKVSVRNIEGVLRALVERGLDRFVRVKEEVNREAILAEPEAVKGVAGIKIENREEFVIVPFETALENVA